MRGSPGPGFGGSQSFGRTVRHFSPKERLVSNRNDAGGALFPILFARRADQAAGTVAASKNRAWLIAAFTVERWKGLVIK